MKERPDLGTVHVIFAAAGMNLFKHCSYDFRHQSFFPPVTTVARSLKEVRRIRLEEPSCANPSKRNVPNVSDCDCEHAYEITGFEAADARQVSSSSLRVFKKSETF